MFAKAVALSGQYTRPVIISKYLENKDVQAGIATFVMVNADGWIVTAAHVLQGLIDMQNSTIQKAAYLKAVEAINANTSYSTKQKKREISQLKPNLHWITNHSLWWGVDGITVKGDATVDPTADLAVAQLTGPIDKLNVTSFPTFANSKGAVAQGTSLCRLGYPFHDIKAVYDQAKGQFQIPNLPHLAMFPNDGIVTRNVMTNDNPIKRMVHFIETSTPGLLGQSGGPVFDVEGTVWGLQVRTVHLSLGFSPKVKVSGKEIVEHQFMHCGWATHVSHVRELLDRAKVTYQSK